MGGERHAAGAQYLPRCRESGIQVERDPGIPLQQRPADHNRVVDGIDAGLGIVAPALRGAVGKQRVDAAVSGKVEAAAG
jgi:hypothetical protein